MLTHARLSTFLPSPRIWLVAFALAIGGLVFAPFYVMTAIYPWLPHSFRVVPWWFQALTLFDLVRNLLFIHPVGYVASSLLGITVVMAALLWARPHWVVRFVLALTLLAIVAFPWFYAYQPALVAAPGMRMRVPTQPGWLDGVVKSAQAAAEVRPCTYSLLGWSQDGTFYFQALCANEPLQTWAINPDRESSERMVPSAPLELFVERATVKVYDLVRAEGVRPIIEEPNARRVYLQEGSLLSPDGYWVALVARHLYGPEDVVIVQWARQE